MVVSLIARAASQFVGVLWPAYSSFKALKVTSDAEDDLNQHRMWLVYWVIFAIFSSLELWTDTLIFWLPFYYELKLGFLLYLQLPQTKGALKLYESYVHPMLLQYEPVIDNHIDSAKDKAISHAGSLKDKAFAMAVSAVPKIQGMLNQSAQKNASGSSITVEEVDDDEPASSSKKDK